MKSVIFREVIRRRPEEFKIACLRDINSLFGNSDAFYAGFGNRITVSHYIYTNKFNNNKRIS